jgi:hypothetical protein
MLKREMLVGLGKRERVKKTHNTLIGRNRSVGFPYQLLDERNSREDESLDEKRDF